MLIEATDKIVDPTWFLDILIVIQISWTATNFAIPTLYFKTTVFVLFYRIFFIQLLKLYIWRHKVEILKLSENYFALSFDSVYACNEGK